MAWSGTQPLNEEEKHEIYNLEQFIIQLISTVKTLTKKSMNTETTLKKNQWTICGFVAVDKISISSQAFKNEAILLNKYVFVEVGFD